MAAISSPANLVELVQVLQDQQQQHRQAADTFAQTLKELQVQQREHANAVAKTLKQIGDLLSSLLGGLSPLVAHAAPAGAPPAAGRAATRAATGAATGASGSAGATGNDFVMAFVRKHGSPTSAQVNQEWIAAGRKHKADITLSQLVKAGKLKRSPNPAGRGSLYSVV
jgi:hypothetical protein